ncbi:MAG: 2-succinyl-6-hydroxy-2,4-cyclohexadiene-carboxylate synthase [Solirubrobacteraceae bacterium]|nr:2-succinyl-6-hydroxy-2,4-cyclohexadiene-carboxylate synthase [Solirubrobacteraceae bacterium]
MALLLLHGFTHTGASWAPVRAMLPERYRALAPDLRGHGSAGAAQPVTLDAVLGDLAALAPPEGLTLAGYSMGGRIALHAALSAPFAGRIQRLVLIGASPGLADPAERAARRAADERLADEIERLGREGAGIAEFARRWATSTPVLAGQPAEVLELIHQDRLRNTPAGLARALRGLGTGALPSLWERLGEGQLPVTLVVGERDEKFTAIAEQMAARLPDARLEVVPGVGHAVHLEAPARVAALLAE